MNVRRAASSWWASALVWALVFALVAVHSLGLLHGFAHGAGHFQQHAQATHLAAAGGRVAQADVGAAPAFAKLFAGHASDADCLSFDQLSHAPILLAMPALSLSAALPLAVFDQLQGDFVARWAALFEARGPPNPR